MKNIFDDGQLAQLFTLIFKKEGRRNNGWDDENLATDTGSASQSKLRAMPR